MAVPPFIRDKPVVNPEQGLNVSINVGPVTVDQPNTAKSLPGIQTGNPGIWTDYRVINRYENNKNIWQMGLTSPQPFQGGSVGIVQLASPTLLWIADWTASKTEECPQIPDPRPPNSSSPWVLLDAVVEPAMLLLAADGITPYYQVSGTYVYCHKNPSDVVTRDARFPQPPWMQDGFLRTISDSQLRTSIIAPSQG